MGGLYSADGFYDHYLDYCEECGDHDWYVGVADTKDEARKLLEDYRGYGHNDEYVNGFIEDVFGEDKT
jgi:hypothetical protein